MGKNSSRSDAASFHLHPSGNCQCLSTFSSNSRDLHIFAGKFMSKWCIWEVVFSELNLSLDCKMQLFHWNKSPQEDQTLIKLTARNKLVQQKFCWIIRLKNTLGNDVEDCTKGLSALWKKTLRRKLNQSVWCHSTYIDVFHICCKYKPSLFARCPVWMFVNHRKK